MTISEATLVETVFSPDDNTGVTDNMELYILNEGDGDEIYSEFIANDATLLVAYRISSTRTAQYQMQCKQVVLFRTYRRSEDTATLEYRILADEALRPNVISIRVTASAP